MRVLAHRGNRLHAPENTRTALVSAYTAGADALEFDVQLTRDGRLVVSHDPSLARLAGEGGPILETDLADLRKLDLSRTFAPRGASEWAYRQPGRRRVEVETFPALLDKLPRAVAKVVELKHDSSLTTGRRDKFVRAAMRAILDRGILDEVVLYSKDPENLRLVRQLAPEARICVFDWEIPASELLDRLEQLDADGAVIEIGEILAADGSLTEIGRRLADMHQQRGLRVGAVVYLYRDPAVFTQAEYEALEDHAFVWSLATDSMLDVAFTRPSMKRIDASFAGTTIDRRRFAFGYAKANRYAHVFQDDGVHVKIAAYEDGLPAATDAVARQLQQLEERVWYANKDWPFYSGGGVGTVNGIAGPFTAEVDYTVTRVGQASTLELAAVNVDPGAHQPPFDADGNPRVPRSFRDKDSFYDPHGAPPFVGVEHDEDDGFRINWNLGTEYDNNQYGTPCGDGNVLSGRLRLERRGAWFSAYYRNDYDTPDWVCVGVVRNESLNPVVYLRCAGKRWRQEREDDPTQYYPIVPVEFVFSNFLVTTH